KIIQGAGDRVIDPKSAHLIIDRIGSKEKSLHMIPSERHGILNEDIGGTQDIVIGFVQSLAPATSAAAPSASRAPVAETKRWLARTLGFLGLGQKDLT
ncbi:MAG: serine aminopeptidase domain-containing protein, partial [Rhodospirillales bacterium]